MDAVTADKAGPVAAGTLLPAAAAATPEAALLPACFAAVSAAEARGLALTPPQRTAIEKITSGYTLVDAASAAGVNRTTLYRWLKHDAEFQAAFNAWQHDALATARGRLLGLTDSAVTTVAKGIQSGDRGMAKWLLERLGVAKPAAPGSTDAKEIARQEKIERDKADLAMRMEESKLDLEKSMYPANHGEES